MPASAAASSSDIADDKSVVVPNSIVPAAGHHTNIACQNRTRSLQPLQLFSSLPKHSLDTGRIVLLPMVRLPSKANATTVRPGTQAAGRLHSFRPTTARVCRGLGDARQLSIKPTT